MFPELSNPSVKLNRYGEMKEMKLKQGLNANHLKMIAIIAMTIDHICDLVYPGFPVNPMAIGLHVIGRLTAPIMWFFVCEGYRQSFMVLLADGK